ncbi:MAG: hypothetical protein ABI348_02820 [Nitrososphaera sp.]
MSSKRRAFVPVIIAAAIVAAAGIIAVAYVQAAGENNKPAGNSPDLRLIASRLEERVASSVKVMELTGAMPAVRNTDSQSLVSTAQMGIPQDADPAKREVAKDIVATYGDVASIFFLMPNGDLYLGEPFEQQKQLPKLNYSDRDWYQGVSSTGDSTSALCSCRRPSTSRQWQLPCLSTGRGQKRAP